MNDAHEPPKATPQKLSINAKMVALIVIALLLLLIFAAFLPFAFARVNMGRSATALHNGKDIYISMYNYAFNNNGMLPAAKENANASLRVLFEGQYILNEKPFHVNGVGGRLRIALKGDENIEGGEALKEGELYFTYWTQANGMAHKLKENKAGNPCLSIPNLAAPGVTNLKDAVFHDRVMGRNAVVISIDGAANVHRFNKEGIIESYEPKEGYSMEQSVEMDWNECSPLYPLGTKNVPEK